MLALHPEQQATARRADRLVRSAAFLPEAWRVACLRPVALPVRFRGESAARRGLRPEAAVSPEPRTAAAQQVQRREPAAVGRPAE